MSNSSTPTLDQLKRAVAIAEKIQALEDQLSSILGRSAPVVTKVKPAPVVVEPAIKVRKKTKMSAAGRAAIVAAQKARWDKIKADKAAALVPAESQQEPVVVSENSEAPTATSEAA